MSICSEDYTNSTAKSDCEYDSQLDPDVDMRMEDDVDAPDGGDLDGDVDMERDGDDDEEEDELEEDEEKEDEEEDEEEEENKDEDDGKEPRMIGQGAMVNTLADDADIMVEDEPIVLPKQGQEMRKHTPRPQPLAPAPRPQTPEPPLSPQTPETHTLSGLEFSELVTLQKPHPAAPTLREAEAAGNTSDVDVDLQLLGESAFGDSLPDVPLQNLAPPDIPPPDVPLPNVRLPNVLLPKVPLSEAPPDSLVGEE